ncbi:quinone-dependent dihydroorotate dehydrogenase [Marinoscillum furvescens]|uniref:Dihydroorotate dehydrogenase (quinone) n=1 Tax=Marinoscillum furvescens DSM 4134 TaxID=1122208 RepID=A0A3D9LIX2_MARFU|nr:quinone-dependent dihydroorotate dehydrogenase [Marinoscillum furvescens]REE05763.1 dihydroorotate oxidase A [Marinoscillum furvescens DSM 4134]
MYQLAKKFLFTKPAEEAHHFTTKNLKRAFKLPFVKSIFKSIYTVNDPRLEREVFGLKFKNPVGLAAGFDKNADYIHEFAGLGFGFIEIGTITPKAQPGNPQPRLFRLPEDEALINRMGFNNNGMKAALANLKKRPNGIIVGGNIGKNKITPNEEATLDYLKCFDTLYPVVDYFVVNVSSPNTPGLRELQDKEPLEALLKELQKANKKKASPKPILLKIAPDLTDAQLDDIIEISHNINLDGIIATNTTISREGLQTTDEELDQIGAGGLSGAPVFERSTEVIQYLRAQNRDIPIIAIGGIMSGEDALKKIAAGATLVQVYTGLIYKGPGLVREINEAILKNA